MRVKGVGHLYRPKYRAADGTTRESAVFWWKLGPHRVSTGCRTEPDAQAWAVKRLVEMQRGHLVGVREGALRWDDIERMLEDRWSLDGRKGLLQARSVLRRLRRAWAGWKTEAITTDAITRYAVRRRDEGAAPATVNLELAVLRRGFGLAREAGRLAVIPVIHRLPGVRHRTGTVERGDLEAILAALPEKYHAPIRFLHLTGWREGEALGLTWQHVDLGAGELRLDTSKTGEPRRLHFGTDSALGVLLRDVADSRAALSPYVCVEAGTPHLLIHDLRRTMVRDLRRAGVPLAVAMASVGHRSLDIHQGYSVVAASDLEAGLERVEALRAGEPVQQRLAAFGGGGSR
jgi:integrase